MKYPRGVFAASSNKLRMTLCDGSEFSSGTGSASCTSNPEVRVMLNQEFDVYPNVILTMRHSERVDDLFPDWFRRAKDEEDKYKPLDINMPRKLPLDKPLEAYNNDTPLTITGDVLARLVGRGIQVAGYCPDIIYCSPALRCLQTAAAVRSSTKCSAMLWVEPALYENTSLYPEGKPQLPTPEQRAKFGVDPSYQPMKSFDELFAAPESVEDYNTRIQAVLNMISRRPQKTKEKKDLVVLIVGHASTVDMAVGMLRVEPRLNSREDLYKIGDRVPYCSIISLERIQGKRGWTPNPYAIAPVTYQNFSNVFQHEFVYRE